MSEFASVDHLGPEAVVAFVDEEMDPTAQERAMNHLLACETCRREVRLQRQTAARLRAGSTCVSSDLMQRLQGIDSNCPEGPGVESLRQAPQTLMDRLDIIARSLKSSFQHNQTRNID
ncbi:MAG: anti-sigma factor [Corynebacterium sp.]|nr:anti-sigma factor [Corynebacterium sp.]